MLTADKTALIIVDVQVKLARVMHDKEALLENLQKLIKGAQALGLPILWLEQYPQGMGPTIPEVDELLSDVQPISKLSFSCCGNEAFMRALRALPCTHILVAGIEAHVCVYQTARDLVGLGYEVEVVVDAVASRTLGNKQIALEKIRDVGATVTSTETALFELLGVAEGPAFKRIQEIVK